MERGNYAGIREVADSPIEPEDAESQGEDKLEVVDGPRRSGWSLSRSSFMEVESFCDSFS